MILDVQALADIRKGQPEVALKRYQAALPGQAVPVDQNGLAGALRGAVLVAVLHRLTGDPQTADLQLRELLKQIESVPIAGDQGIGFTRFTVHALLCETDAAIREFKAALDAGWVMNWSELKQGDFDLNYAAVTADPRFQTLYDQLNEKVNRMRDAYLANPELPDELLRGSGLLR